MVVLKTRINDKIKDDSLEFKSLMDENKNGSFQRLNLTTLDSRGNKRKKINVARDMEFSLEDFAILHYNNAEILTGGGYL